MNKPKKSTKSVRLPSHIKPEHYLLTIKPDLEAFTFAGEEIITLSLSKPVKEITLHSKELDIEVAEIIGKQVTFAQKISYDEKAETATFHFSKPLPKGKIKLQLVFRGILNDKLRGFYRSKYSHEGKEKHMATTQFEATDARRAFPCFDEPAQKAVFEVNLVVPEDLTAISNTLPTEIHEHDAGYKIMHFAPSPKMSTYLLAFIIGDFEYVERKTKSGVQVRIYTVPGKKHQAGFALDCAVRTLEFYNKYFDIPYPLNTLDMIAIPDFASGAMENWGAVTYRESMLLVDEKNSSTQAKQWIALVIAHELAHQWFGNLVTMEWWTHLWLNEGFASYIEYVAVDALFPGWKIWQQFVTADLGSALSLDALENTHPIEVDVHHPNEISEIFDAVSYSKGASIIRMLAEYLGEKDFRDGLRYYLKKHSYKNASTVHLWQALEKISKKSVRKMMSVWTAKAGYPLLQVSQKERELTVQQSRFFSSPLSKNKSKDGTLWSIPISIQNGQKKSKYFLTKRNERVILSPSTSSGQAPSSWHKINAGETSLVCIAYDSMMQKSLEEPIKKKMIPAEDRLGIIRDLGALSEAGILPATQALETLPSFKNEEEYVVWVEIISALGDIYALLEKEDDKKKFEKMTQELLSPIGRKIGWNAKKKEEHSHALLRSLILSALGKYGHQQTILEAKKRFVILQKDKTKISPDIRPLILGITARYGDKKEYAMLQKMYQQEPLHEAKNRIGMALGMFQQKELIEKTLAFALSDDVRAQDTPSIIASVFANQKGRDSAWGFMKKEWKMLLSRYGEGGHILTRFIQSMAIFNDTKHADDIEKFFKKNPAPAGERAILQVLEKIRSNAAWKTRDAKKVSEWLNKNTA